MMKEKIEDPEQGARVENNAVYFLDSGVILSTDPRDLYLRHLRKNKAPNNQHLSLNTDLPEDCIDYSVDSLITSRGFCSSLTSPRVTEGVRDQVLPCIREIRENIKRRGSNFVFTEFNRLLPQDVRDSGRRIYFKLQEMAEYLDESEEFVQKNTHPFPTDRNYFLLEDFVRTIGSFFEIGKQDHEFDFYTDEGLVATALYEALVQNHSVSVVSTDRDVRNFLGFSQAILEKVKPLTSRHPKFQFFYENPPKFVRYPLTNQDTNGVSFLEDAMYLSGFSKFVPDSETSAYHKQVTEFERHLTGTTRRLLDSI